MTASPAMRGRIHVGGMKAPAAGGCTCVVNHPHSMASPSHASSAHRLCRQVCGQPQTSRSHATTGTTTAVGLASSANANAPVASQ